MLSLQDEICQCKSELVMMESVLVSMEERSTSDRCVANILNDQRVRMLTQGRPVQLVTTRSWPIPLDALQPSLLGLGVHPFDSPKVIETFCPICTGEVNAKCHNSPYDKYWWIEYEQHSESMSHLIHTQILQGNDEHINMLEEPKQELLRIPRVLQASSPLQLRKHQIQGGSKTVPAVRGFELPDLEGRLAGGGRL
jgi:hypothetical protein